MSTQQQSTSILSDRLGGMKMKLMQTRRDFLKLAGKVIAGGAAAAAVPAMIPTAEAASAKMATAGIVRGKVTDTNSNMMPAVILVKRQTALPTVPSPTPWAAMPSAWSPVSTPSPSPRGMSTRLSPAR